MKLEKAERSQLERIVAISKRAFETDVAVGGAVWDYPPEYDTPIWNVRTNSLYKKLGYIELKQEDGFSFYQKNLK